MEISQVGKAGLPVLVKPKNETGLSKDMFAALLALCSGEMPDEVSETGEDEQDACMCQPLLGQVPVRFEVGGENEAKGEKLSGEPVCNQPKTDILEPAGPGEKPAPKAAIREQIGTGTASVEADTGKSGFTLPTAGDDASLFPAQPGLKKMQGTETPVPADTGKSGFTLPTAGDDASLFPAQPGLKKMQGTETPVLAVSSKEPVLKPTKLEGKGSKVETKQAELRSAVPEAVPKEEVKHQGTVPKVAVGQDDRTRFEKADGQALKKETAVLREQDHTVDEAPDERREAPVLEQRVHQLPTKPTHSKQEVSVPRSKPLPEAVSEIVTRSEFREVPAEFELELEPESLGRLHVKVRNEDGTVRIRFVADTDRAYGILSENLGNLKDALARSGISQAEINLSFGANHQEENGWTPGDFRPSLPDWVGEQGEPKNIRSFPEGTLNLFV